jgi:hypothetical protein
MLRRVLVVLCTLAVPAHADEVDDLVAQGNALAQKSEYTQAISAFKQADAKRPRAAHACMIGLAYMRREAWPQAELFLALCEKRAVPGDQPPDWVDAAHQQLASKLSAAQIPAITIEVTPPDAGARLTVSSFAPDEVFDPQTIHLAPGVHVIALTAPGYRKASRQISVEAGVPQTISFTLEREPEGAAVLPPRVPAQHDAGPRSSRVPWIVIGAGAALFGAGVIYDAVSVQPARDRLATAETRDAYDALAPDFRSSRNVAIGLLAGGALVTGIGVALKLTVFDSKPQVSASIDHRGGVVVIGWQR